MVQGHFLTIDPDECRRLLADANVGRVCWLSSAGLQVLPVNYGVAEGAVVFRVAPASILAELVRPVDVVFEVDDLDGTTATGWSVLVRGSTVQFTGDVDAVVPHPWAPGDRSLGVAI
ncbi:MAG TPA: pyridoxamine 5'-phosphate oxidase family protein, partial [Propionibacteriaceae bacterium]|nr:pyridoxamine 5'-phosphate oxidase family protein [Propionibacteriaceae bacterium]